MVDRPTITRRRALALGAAAGLGSLVAPALALGSHRRGARGFGLTVSPADFDGGRVSRVLSAPRRFDLLGLRGAGAVEVRTRARGAVWSRWVALTGHGDHAPDGAGGERASDPVWSGAAHELQLRAPRPPRAPLRLHLVAVPARALGRGAVRAAAIRARPGQAPAPGTPPPIIPRVAWGADGVPPRADPGYGEVQLAFVHHTVTVNEYTPQDSAQIVLGIAKYHRDVNGWNDIGYNFLVDRFGQVFEGRAGGTDQAVVGAQAQGYNRVSTGIAHLGTHGDVPLGEPAMAATAQLLGWKMSLHGVPTEGAVTVISGGGPSNRYRDGIPVTLQRISGHRDGDATSCPGNALYAQLPELRRRATALAGPLTPREGTVTLSAVGAVVYGEAASFRGAVTRSDGSAGAGETVAVQKRSSTGAWVTIARAIAGADGAWSAAASWRRGGDVRAVVAGAASAVASVDVLPRIEQPTRTRRVMAGSAITLAGRVRPSSPVGVLVEIQGRDGIWRRVRVVRARVARTAWKTTVFLRRPGLYRFTPRTGASAAPALYVRARRRRGRARAGGVAAR